MPPENAMLLLCELSSCFTQAYLFSLATPDTRYVNIYVVTLSIFNYSRCVFMVGVDDNEVVLEGAPRVKCPLL